MSLTRYNNYFKHISHIPHFYMIRSVESRLMSDYIAKTEKPFLDLGCGNGVFGKSLELDEVYGIDIDEKALRGVKDDGYYKKVLLASSSEIPFPDGMFGTVFANCALEHMDKLHEVIAETRRVLKVGGNFIFTVPVNNFIGIARQDEVLEMYGLNSEESMERYNEIHHHVNILDYEEWLEKLEKVGFNVLEHCWYLPGSIGKFVARMDVLHTLESEGSKNCLRRLEKRYRSLRGLSFRIKFKRYLRNPHQGEQGTHLILKVMKHE